MGNISQTTHDNFLLAQLCNHKLFTYLNSYLLEAPHEYVRHGLVPGLDWTPCWLSSTCIFLDCPGPPSILLFVPTIHVSHMYPPLPEAQLNTSAHGYATSYIHHHTYLHHTYITIHSFLHTSSTPLGSLAGPDPSCLAHVYCVNCLLHVMKVHSLYLAGAPLSEPGFPS